MANTFEKQKIREAQAMADGLRDEVMRLYNYDPETGVFTWKVRQAKCVKIGSIAGKIIGKGYRELQVFGSSWKAHRLAWLIVHGKFPSEFIDHQNGLKDDNRISNLRPATLSQNAMNKRRQSNNTSGETGVKVTASGKFLVRVMIDGKSRAKVVPSMEEATELRDQWKRQLHGEFSSTERRNAA